MNHTAMDGADMHSVKYGTKITGEGIVITCNYTRTDAHWDGKQYVYTPRQVSMRSREVYMSFEDADAQIVRWKRADRKRGR